MKCSARERCCTHGLGYLSERVLMLVEIAADGGIRPLKNRNHYRNAFMAARPTGSSDSSFEVNATHALMRGERRVHWASRRDNAKGSSLESATSTVTATLAPHACSSSAWVAPLTSSPTASR